MVKTRVGCVFIFGWCDFAGRRHVHATDEECSIRVLVDQQQ